MKPILLTITILFFYSTNSFAQEVSYKYLIGKWLVPNAQGDYKAVFFDSSHLYYTYSTYPNKAEDTITYKLGVVGNNQPILYVYGHDKNGGFIAKYLLRIKNRNTLFVQGLLDYRINATVWLEQHKGEHTYKVWKRIKK